MKEEIIINSIKQKIKERQVSIENIIQDNSIIKYLSNLCFRFYECFERGNKLIFCGNGGSAADCQHIVAEFIVKLSKLRKSLPAISLTCNNSIITAIANDIEFNYIFTRQLEGIAKPDDILIGISTSGNSQNIINAFEYADKNNIYTVSVTGNNINKLSDLGKLNIIVPSQNTQIVQEMYIMLFHIICQKIDEMYENSN